MKTYIVLLRGINVSGHRPLKMAALKDMLVSMGFKNIRTYIQSGNVILQSGKHDLHRLAQKISTRIEEIFGYNNIPVICLTAENLKNIIAQNPFTKDAEKDEKYMHYTFLDGDPDANGKEVIMEKLKEGEAIKYGERVVYLYCPKGYGTSNLTNDLFEKKLKVRATTRNYRTTHKVLEMALKL